MRYFGVKLTKVPQGQMGTKPAKVAHRPSWPTKAAKLGRFPETEDLFAKRSSRSAGGLKLLKWPASPDEGSNLLKFRQLLMPTTPG